MEQRFEVNQQDLQQTRTRAVEVSALEDGSIRVAVERFALTANNITYAVVGDRIGYWRFFPASSGWGIIPVWGFASVVESRNDALSIGERLYGFWPMASHCDLKPDRVHPARLMDASAHRLELPAVYNAYARVQGEPGYDPGMDDERMLLFPLYATSYCLSDFLVDNEYFGAEQVVVCSASSKTALGLAYALAEDDAAPRRLGLTSQRNLDAVRALDLYHDVRTYDDLEGLPDGLPTVIVDMSGNGDVLSRLHRQLGDNMRYTSNVGVTHYEANEMGEHFIKERSAMFFAPGHIKKRSAEWGPGIFEQRALAFWARAATQSRAWLEIARIERLAQLDDAYRKTLAGGYPPHVGLTVSL